MWIHLDLSISGSGLYSSKLGSEPSPGGASPYFSSSMQTAYGQQGKYLDTVKNAFNLRGFQFSEFTDSN